jgi:hypothetical protein
MSLPHSRAFSRSGNGAGPPTGASGPASCEEEAAHRSAR